MNSMTMLPTTAQERETFIAELRCRRLELLGLVYHVDFIATALKNGVVTTEGARLMLNEMFAGPTDE